MEIFKSAEKEAEWSGVGVKCDLAERGEGGKGGRGGRMEDTAQRSDGVIIADLPLVDSSLTFT